MESAYTSISPNHQFTAFELQQFHFLENDSLAVLYVRDFRNENTWLTLKTSQINEREGHLMPWVQCAKCYEIATQKQRKELTGLQREHQCSVSLFSPHTALTSYPGTGSHVTSLEVRSRHIWKWEIQNPRRECEPKGKGPGGSLGLAHLQSLRPPCSGEKSQNRPGSSMQPDNPAGEQRRNPKGEIGNATLTRCFHVAKLEHLRTGVQK